MSSDGGVLSLESPYSPHGSPVHSGLISWFGARYPTCSGLHVTPVVAYELRRHSGPDSAPGSFASRCGPYAGWAYGRLLIVPSRRCVACTKQPCPSRVPDGVTAHGSKHSVERLGSFQVYDHPCLRRIRRSDPLKARQYLQVARHLDRFPAPGQPRRPPYLRQVSGSLLLRRRLNCLRPPSPHGS
jgi:hypothetical protein